MLPALPSNTSGNRLEVNNAGTNDFKVYIFFISSQEETIMNDLEKRKEVFEVGLIIVTVLSVSTLLILGFIFGL